MNDIEILMEIKKYHLFPQNEKNLAFNLKLVEFYKILKAKKDEAYSNYEVDDFFESLQDYKSKQGVAKLKELLKLLEANHSRIPEFSNFYYFNSDKLDLFFSGKTKHLSSVEISSIIKNNVPEDFYSNEAPNGKNYFVLSHFGAIKQSEFLQSLALDHTVSDALLELMIDFENLDVSELREIYSAFDVNDRYMLNKITYTIKQGLKIGLITDASEAKKLVETIKTISSFEKHFFGEVITNYFANAAYLIAQKDLAKDLSQRLITASLQTEIDLFNLFMKLIMKYAANYSLDLAEKTEARAKITRFVELAELLASEFKNVSDFYLVQSAKEILEEFIEETGIFEKQLVPYSDKDILSDLKHRHSMKLEEASNEDCYDEDFY